jgi:hypothetical protein
MAMKELTISLTRDEVNELMALIKFDGFYNRTLYEKLAVVRTRHERINAEREMFAPKPIL